MKKKIEIMMIIQGLGAGSVVEKTEVPDVGEVTTEDMEGWKRRGRGEEERKMRLTIVQIIDEAVMMRTKKWQGGEKELETP